MEDYENEFLNLPDDPEEAFAILQRRKFNDLQKVLTEGRTLDGFDHERAYVDYLLAFDAVNNLGLLESFSEPPINDSDFNQYFMRFRRAAEMAGQKIRIETARRLKSGATNIVVLDATSRSAIHALIDKIREKLNELKLDERKRESLFNKLNAFASEIDRNRTRTEAFHALVIELSRTAKEELGPLKQTLDRVLDKLDQAAKWTEALPPWGERKKIEGPKKQLPPPKPDDEIPF